ncbi:uncharacterized protein LOC143544221 [Bidens hawaiensis]|uniref:uncharacterized protein LOC143544221 n=1 Tax=Bidens hawaiensis TaxID=980011 RepID=UPI00404B4D27
MGSCVRSSNRVDSDDDVLSNDSSLILFNNRIDKLEDEDTVNTATYKKQFTWRDRERNQDVLADDYFVDDPKYNEDIFRQRLRMSKWLFLKIVEDLEKHYEWFQEGYGGRMKKGFTPLQKVTSTVKKLAAGNLSDEYDVYLQLRS